MQTQNFEVRISLYNMIEQQKIHHSYSLTAKENPAILTIKLSTLLEKARK